MPDAFMLGRASWILLAALLAGAGFASADDAVRASAIPPLPTDAEALRALPQISRLLDLPTHVRPVR